MTLHGWPDPVATPTKAAKKITPVAREYAAPTAVFGGKPAGKHEHAAISEGIRSQCGDMQKTMPADGMGISRGPRRKTKGRISYEEASADQS